MSSSFNNDRYDDFTTSEISTKWYSTSKSNDSNNTQTGEPYDYCEFCYYTFKQYNEVLDNICQTCGRPGDYITKNKQETIVVGALNDLPSEQNYSRGVALDIKYPFLDQDEITKSRYHEGERMQTTGGAGEAMRLIRDSEKSVRIHGSSFKIKTTYKEKNVEFDIKEDDK